MSDEHQDDRWLRELLSTEANRYDLDPTVLLARIMPEVRADHDGPITEPEASPAPGPATRRRQNLRPVPDDTRTVPGPRSRAGLRHRARLIPAALAAAGIAAVTTASTVLPSLATRTGGEHRGTVSVQDPPPQTVSPGTPSPVPTVSLGPNPPNSTRPTPQASGQPPSLAGGEVRLSSRRASPGTVITLPGTGDRDWLVAAGPGNTPVRSGRGARLITGPDFHGPQPASADGPFSLRWSAGSSGSRSGSGNRWLTGTGPGSGFRITAPADGGTTTLVLYLGAFDGPAHVTARLASGGSSSSVDLPAPSDPTGYVLTVRFRAQADGDSVLVDVSTDPGAGVGVAAVKLR